MGAEVQYISAEDLAPSHGLACFVDVETTGLSPQTEEVVELALVLFAFDRSTGEILGVVDEYVGLREPTKPIPPQATKIHGITNAMVKGARLDFDRVESILTRAEFLVAHNARFDRPFAAALSPTAAEKQWVCSMNGIDWYGYGFESKGLQQLLKAHGIRPDKAHRALSDVRASLSLLARHSSKGKPYFADLLSKVQPSARASRSRARSTSGERRQERIRADSTVTAALEVAAGRSDTTSTRRSSGCTAVLAVVAGFVMLVIWLL
jgi:DNA polymerase-3 subunit epsilon